MKRVPLRRLVIAPAQVLQGWLGGGCGFPLEGVGG